MAYHQGKKRTVGLAIEAIRGSASTPTYWFPWTDYGFAPKIEVKKDEGNVGVLVDSIDSYVTKQYSEGSIGGKVYPNGIGYLLLATLGKVNSVTTGDNPVHTFEVENVNNHPSLTIATSDPVSDSLYPLAVVDSLQLSAEKGGDFMVTANIKARKGQAPGTALTPGYVSEESFIATDVKVYLADTVADLATANNICLQRFDLTISKNTEDIECMSSPDPIDYMNTSMTLEGTIEMYRENNVYRDIAFNSIAKSLRIQAIDNSVAINGSHPEITIDLAKVKIVERSDAVAIGETIKQTIKFSGHHSIADNKSISIALKNTKTSY